MARLADARVSMACAAGFAALWALLEHELGSRLHQPYDLTQVVWCRYATHLALMFLIFARAPSRLLRTGRPGLQLGRSLLMLVMPLTFAWSVGGAGARITWTVFWLSPLLMLALARWLYAERADALTWGFALLALPAAALVYVPGALPSLGETVLPLAMSLSFALYLVATWALREEPLSANLFYTALAPFAVLTPFMPHVWQMPSAHDAIVLVAIGTVGLVGLGLLDRAVASYGVSLAAPVTGLQVAFVAIFSHGLSPKPGDLLAIAALSGMFLLVWLRAGSPAPMRSAAR